uniref:Putative dna transposase thap9 n=1 Tax=Amblyomma aureolatum TaxID=187763 RepID=A0A1E1XCT1_9ACAR
MTCCVPFCSSYAGKAKLTGEPSVSFHEFPVTNIREAWIKAISREGPNKTLWQPHETAKVCSIHFRLEDYKEGTKGRRLKPNAVPSIFPGYPAYMQISAERIRSKASNQPQHRLTEAFPRVASCPKSKKRLLCDALATEKRDACTEKISKRTSETVCCANPTTPERRTKVIVREPLRTTSQTESTTQRNNSCIPTSEDSRRPAILRLVPAERASREQQQQQQQQPSVAEEECRVPNDQLTLCTEEHRAFGTQTALTGVTLGALCDEIKLLKQRCSELQGQLNDALGENCRLKAKIHSCQGPCGI